MNAETQVSDRRFDGAPSKDVGNKTDDGAKIAHCSTEMALDANLWGLKLITKGFCSSLTASWWLETLVRSNAGVPATAKEKGEAKRITSRR